MSFVSVFANSKLLSLVRVTNNGETVNDNYKKFVMISPKQFIAFAGAKEVCESIVDQVEYLNDSVYDLEQIAKEIHMNIYGKEILDPYNLLFTIGGLSAHNYIEFHTVNNKEEEIASYHPESVEDVTYAYMHNSDIDLDVNSKIVELRNLYGIRSFYDRRKVQRELNKYVSQHDNSVNQITSELKVRKP